MTRKVGNGKKINTSFGILELEVVAGIAVLLKSKLKMKSPNSFTTNGLMLGTLHKFLMFLFADVTIVGFEGNAGELTSDVVNEVAKILDADPDAGKFIDTV